MNKKGGGCRFIAMTCIIKDPNGKCLQRETLLSLFMKKQVKMRHHQT